MEIKKLFILATAVAVMPFNVMAKDTHSGSHDPVSDKVIAEQRNNLAKNTEGKGFGPQSPRDIDSASGSNKIAFSSAPAYSQMNLC
ncbi:MAG: hypothetical protein D3910_29060, partial [Candidatus Electrothrix sp. ATG2]|nr:hypothetical protein [Candidatus Electrothrix sp. ATG2]